MWKQPVFVCHPNSTLSFLFRDPLIHLTLIFLSLCPSPPLPDNFFLYAFLLDLFLSSCQDALYSS